MSSALATMELQATGANPFAPLSTFRTEEYRPYRVPPGLGALPGQAWEPEWDSDRAVREGLKVNAALATCIGRISEKAASVPWFEWRVNKSGTEEPMERVPWMERPRQDGKIGRSTMVELAHHYGYLSGNIVIGVWWEGGRKYRIRPREIQVENPHGCAPVVDRVKYISAYRWDDGAIGGPRYWDAEDIIHVITRPDPANPYWGWSILQALASTIDADREARTMNYLRFRRRGMAGQVVSDSDVKKPEDALEWEESLNQRAHKRFGGFLVLGGTQTIKDQKPLTEVQLGLLKAMAFHRDEIAIACGLHPAIVSSDASTLDNLGVARALEWRIAQVRNKRLADALTNRLIPAKEAGTRYFAPDYSEVEELQELPSKIENVKNMVECRIAVNDAIVATGLPVPMQEGGDRPLVAGNLIPAGDAAESLLADG